MNMAMSDFKLILSVITAGFFSLFAIYNPLCAGCAAEFLIFSSLLSGIFVFLVTYFIVSVFDKNKKYGKFSILNVALFSTIGIIAVYLILFNTTFSQIPLGCRGIPYFSGGPGCSPKYLFEDLRTDKECIKVFPANCPQSIVIKNNCANEFKINEINEIIFKDEHVVQTNQISLPLYIGNFTLAIPPNKIHVAYSKSVKSTFHFNQSLKQKFIFQGNIGDEMVNISFIKSQNYC